MGLSPLTKSYNLHFFFSHINQQLSFFSNIIHHAMIHFDHSTSKNTD